MSSFLYSKISGNISKESLNAIVEITDDKILESILKFILSLEDKNTVLFLIKNDKIPKSMSDDLFKFIIKNNFWEMFLDLDYNKFDIHTKDDFILRKISSEGCIDIVKFLVENGANIHSQDDYALRKSSERGYIEVVKFLVENGANIHAENEEALICASENGHIDVVKFLVKNGANIHEIDDLALLSSIWKGNIEVVKFLVENGANIHTWDDEVLRVF